MKKTYNGWASRQTWNVSLYINNEEGLYRAACRFMESYKGRSPYVAFIQSVGMEEDKTPDGYKWISKMLDYAELNGMMRELVE